MPTTKRVLITGGAGSLGRELARRLAEEGYRIRALDLPSCDFGPLKGLAGTEILRGDVADAALLEGAVTGVDAIVHLAALLPPHSERDRARTMAVNAEGTRRLVEALRRAGPAAHLVLSSSVCVYGDTSRDAPPITTSHPCRPLDAYGESKVAAEGIVRGGGVPHTILRISGVSVPAFLAPPEVWPFTAGQRIEFVCRSDVVEALAACVALPRGTGETWHVSGGPSWRMRGGEYVAALNELLGLAPDEATYSERPGSYDWYDTDASEDALGYQQTTFGAFLEQLGRAIEEAFG